jgi:adenylate cyclase
MKQQLKKLSNKYAELFGLIPDFHAAYHSGTVIRGEVGDIKSQFVFHGESMFITSKIEDECSELGKDLLISSNLIQQLSIPTNYEMIPVGTLTNYPNVNLYTLTETESVSSENVH